MKATKRNTVTRIIAPGIWEDANGSVHWNIPDVLAHCDMEYAPENRKILMDMLRELITENNPEAKIVTRTRPEE